MPAQETQDDGDEMPTATFEQEIDVDVRLTEEEESHTFDPLSPDIASAVYEDGMEAQVRVSRTREADEPDIKVEFGSSISDGAEARIPVGTLIEAAHRAVEASSETFPEVETDEE